MVTQQQLKNLYETQLKPQLAGMDQQRKNIKKWRNLAIVAAVIVFVSYQMAKHNNYYLIAVGLFFIAAIFCAINASIRYQAYTKEFKSEVVSKIIKLLNHKFSYKPKGHISKALYNQSGIFPENPDRCKGDDLITGTVEEIPFQFSELKTEEKHETRDDDGRSRTSYITIFQGIFIVAEFNKHLGSRTFVVPQNDRSTTNIFGKEKKRAYRFGEMVKLEDPRFEEIFSVYGTSQQEARYILTPTMMEAIVEIYQKYDLRMYFSFIGGNVHCAIPMGKNMFEAKVTKDGVKYEDIEEMFMLFGLVETIIKEMNLNTRIWTKE
jgi:hypothetical protein